MSTLKQILEALQPLQKLLELLNPRYDSVLRHTFEQGRLSRMVPASNTKASFSVSRVGAAGGYLNAPGTAGSLLTSSGPGKEAGLSLRSMPGLSKGLRRARDEHGGQLMPTDTLSEAPVQLTRLQHSFTCVPQATLTHIQVSEHQSIRIFNTDLLYVHAIYYVMYLL